MSKDKENISMPISAEQMHTLINDMPEYICAFYPDGTLIFTNIALAAVIDKKPEELVGVNLFEIFDSKNVAIVKNSISALTPENPSEVHEQCHLLPDGGKRYHEWRNKAFFDTQGKVIRYQSVGIDITKRKEQEEALRESQKQLTDVIDFLPDAMLAINKEKRVIIWNRAMQHMTGISADEMLGKGDYAYTIPFYGERRPLLMDIIFEDKDNISNKYSQLTYEGGAVSAKAYCPALYNNKGAWIYAKASPLRDSNGDVFGAIEIVRDITKDKEAEDSLNQSALQFDRWMKASFIGVITVTPDGRVLISNDAFCRMTGYTSEDIKQDKLNWKLMTPPEHILRDSLAEKEILLHGVFEPFEKEYFRKDGSRVPVLIGGAFLKQDVNEQIVFVVDLSERKKAEKESQKLQQQILQIQKMELIGRLAGGVAHDFNNMLSVIIGRIELALRKAQHGQSVSSDLDEINKAAHRSAGLTRQLLAFARKQTISPRVINLNDTVKGMMQMLKHLIGEGVKLELELTKEIWPVHMDTSQVDQILANLCINARDAINGVGNIIIETTNLTLNHEQLIENMDPLSGDFVVLTVTDNGSGMEKKVVNKVFEPFFTTKEQGKGTGLGLATIYGIVKQNGGYITVNSEINIGSCFRIYIPRYIPKEELEQIAQEGIVTSVEVNEVVLVVEDEPDVLSLTKTMLEEIGYCVLSASTPSSAIGLAKHYNGQVDLLLTDVIMPEMTGKDLSQKISAIYPKIKTLFMSGYSADVIANQGVLNESVHFIQKPFFMDDLGNKIRETLDSN
ncbi:MAG: PAS domain S-box protein [Deltaproteobacteria bacterium]|nr:PAS domain S-box protein [Deltaproteobacteria bacterium]